MRRWYCHPHFTDKETKAQSSCIICLKSHRQQGVGLGPEWGAGSGVGRGPLKMRGSCLKSCCQHSNPSQAPKTLDRELGVGGSEFPLPPGSV